MPAIYSSNKSTILAPSDDLQYWEPMYYEEHTRITDQLDTITQGMYRDLVKAVKWWQYHHSPQSKPLSGFALECLVATYFDKNNHLLLPAFDNFLKNIISKHRHRGQLSQVLELGSKSNYKQTNLSDRGHKKFIQTVEYTLSLINQAKVATSLAQELGLWQQVFGTPFPRILSRLQLEPDHGIESADTHDDLLYLDKGFAPVVSVKPPEELERAASVKPPEELERAASVKPPEESVTPIETRFLGIVEIAATQDTIGVVEGHEGRTYRYKLDDVIGEPPVLHAKVRFSPTKKKIDVKKGKRTEKKYVPWAENVEVEHEVK
jgi:hypothetical protein